MNPHVWTFPWCALFFPSEASLSGSTGFQSGAASADPTLAQWAPEASIFNGKITEFHEIKGPDNPTSQLLPIMCFKGCSGVGEGRKDKGGGERLCVKVCEKIVCMYVCMYIYIYYICMYVRTYVRMYVCMYECMYVYVCDKVARLVVFLPLDSDLSLKARKETRYAYHGNSLWIQGCVLNTRSHDVSHSPSSSSTRL